MAVKPVPDKYHAITPYLIVQGAAAAIEFYKDVFGATELMRLNGPNGTIGHAEIQIGDSIIMLAEEHLDRGVRGPKAFGGCAITIHLYIAEVDKVFQKAIAAGAMEKRPVIDQFYGDRSGMFEDPFGHSWNVSTHIEDVSPEELQRRIEKMK